MDTLHAGRAIGLRSSDPPVPDLHTSFPQPPASRRTVKAAFIHTTKQRRTTDIVTFMYTTVLNIPECTTESETNRQSAVQTGRHQQTVYITDTSRQSTLQTLADSLHYRHQQSTLQTPADSLHYTPAVYMTDTSSLHYRHQQTVYITDTSRQSTLQTPAVYITDTSSLHYRHQQSTLQM